VVVKFLQGRQPVHRLHCCCYDCVGALVFAAGKGGPAAPERPLDLVYFRNDLEVAQGADKIGFFKLKEGYPTTRMYATCCWTVLAGDHPAYQNKRIVSYPGSGLTMDYDTIELRGRVNDADLTAEERAALGAPFPRQPVQPFEVGPIQGTTFQDLVDKHGIWIPGGVPVRGTPGWLQQDSETTKYFLSEKDIPTHWYNIQADLPTPVPPPLHPGTQQPIGPADLAPLFPMALIEQEVSLERYIEIPKEVRDVYRIWRPSPLFRARRLEKALGIKSKIFYKYEGVSPSGSHKPNTSVPQAFYNKQAGTKKLCTETGAGQWGCSLAFAGKVFDLPVEVFQVKVSYKQKPYRRAMMETWGATCYASPSQETEVGRQILEKDPDCPGSLGIAISEACERAAATEENKYALGSVLNHVLLHQTVTGIEAIKQMEMAGEYPDVLVGCTGGGSNFGGLCFPFIGQKLRGEAKKAIRVVAVEPASCPSLTKGKYAYDFGDTAQKTPLVKSHTLGHTFMPPPTHSGGLRYHAMAPLISHLKELGELEAEAIPQLECFEAGSLFANTEGIVPAPEANHAVAGAIRAAKAAKEGQVVLFNLCGHGHFDMAAWTNYNEGNLTDYDFPAAEVAMALAGIPLVEGHN